MPFYGDEMGVQAPNLAKLAAEGMAFNNTYCQQAICSPTRNSFMTYVNLHSLECLCNH